MSGILDKYFGFTQHETTIKKEIIAGITTFLTIAYIIFINPKILGLTGMDKDAVFTSTCLISAFATLMMGVYANSPIGLVPGMALNTFFTYVVVQTEKFSWENALGMVLISGCVFLLLTVTNIRNQLIKAMPACMNVAILVGISLLLGLIALKTNNIVMVEESGVIHLGNLASRETSLFFLGFLLILVLDYNQIQGSLIIGILGISLLNFVITFNGMPDFISMPKSITPIFWKFKFDEIQNAKAYKQVFSFILIALFDATGTIIGLLHTPLFERLPGKDKKVARGLVCDSSGTIVAAVIGCSSTSPAVESASGIEVGGRTGFTSVVVALCFIVALFVSPIVELIPDFAVGAALLYIACCIMKDISRLEVGDITDFAPSVLTMVMIPFSFSIADGIGVGVISYTVLKLLTKKFNQLNAVLVILTGIFLYYFVGLSH
jgi:AGZA family xanthine/uracil permease-like MFS transporter